jgi:surface-anchored protein
MNMRFVNERLTRAFVPLWVVAGFLAVGLPSGARADLTIADRTRINIDIAYDDMGWHLSAFDDFSGDPYEANEVLLYASAATRATVPDDPEFAFLGAAPGSTVWVLPQAFNPGKLSMSVTTEEIADGTFASYYESDPRVRHTAAWVKLTLKDVRGPGDMSVWQDDHFGHPVVWMATADGITDDDAIFIQLGLDADFTFAFTAPGLYHVKFQASAYLPGETEPTVSDVVTYWFGVETTGHRNQGQHLHRP